LLPPKVVTIHLPWMECLGQLEVNMGKCKYIGGVLMWLKGDEGMCSYCGPRIILFGERLIDVQPFGIFPAFIKFEQYLLSVFLHQFNSLCILHPMCPSYTWHIGHQSPIFQHCIAVKFCMQLSYPWHVLCVLSVRS
jgi:hypothetical protein